MRLLQKITAGQVPMSLSTNKKSPDNVRALTRVKDGARTRDLRNHNPAL